jgi:hypothetical protein
MIMVCASSQNSQIRTPSSVAKASLERVEGYFASWFAGGFQGQKNLTVTTIRAVSDLSITYLSVPLASRKAITCFT